jgi:protoporphyrinogen oxidase
MKNYDFIIIGGGIAGCHTAMKLKKKYPKKKIILVEKSKRIGGRLLSIETKDGKIEAGAARFSNHHKLLNILIDDLGISKKKNKIGSDVEYISTDKKFSYDNLPFNKVEDLMRDLVKKAKKLPISTIKKHSLTSFCEKIYGKEVTKFLIDAFPYYARIHYMNLYDCLRAINDYIDYKRQFYSLSDGLQQVPLECAKLFKKNGGKILMETKLIDIVDHSVFLENKLGNLSEIHGDKIIVAIPQEFLKQIPLFNKTQKIKSLVNSVEPYELMRIYAKYPINKKIGKVWFHDLPRKVSTNNKIKFIIQINPDKGLIMISYPNSDYTKYWKNKNNKETMVSLAKYLKQIFPEKDIPDPIWIKSFFWNTGGNIWLPGKDSDKLAPKMLQPFNNHIYVVGESYSQWQAWVEGALETSTKLLKML